MHLCKHPGKINYRGCFHHPETLECSERVNRAGYIIQSADGHTAEMEALTPDAAYPPAFDKPDLFSSGGEPDRCDPAGRAATQNNDRGISVNHNEKNLVLSGGVSGFKPPIFISKNFATLVHRFREQFAGECIHFDDLLAPYLPDRDIDLLGIDSDIFPVGF